ncbi:MAG TPA: M23 family metallopeptidase [Anaeromyxobacter sp.]
MQKTETDHPRRSRLAPAVALAGLAAVLALAVAGASGRLRFPLPSPAPLGEGSPGTSPLPSPAPRGEGSPGTSPAPPDRAPVATPSPGVLIAPAVAAPPSPPPARFAAVTSRLARNQTVAQALSRLDVGAGEVKAVIDALKGLFPFHHARPGDQLRVERREGDATLQHFTYRQGPADEWTVERLPDGTLRAAKRAVTLTTVVSRVEVTIGTSLYESLQKAGEDPNLAVLASDVLAWDVDFYQDVRSGDRMRMVVERILADGKPLRFGEVLAAEYEGSTTGRKRLFRYTDAAGQTSYFDEEGQSARRGFLKSPLKFANVTSRFGNRKHPVLGYTRAHEGVDYGAPTGTPVWAVGDGQVKQSGWNGGCGKAVTIHHRNGYDTVYCHLSGIAVSAGKSVTQKQVIGWVGQTGLATGPHLHYAVKHGGAFMNPLQLKVPRGEPIAPAEMETYRGAIAPLRARLEGDLARL